MDLAARITEILRLYPQRSWDDHLHDMEQMLHVLVVNPQRGCEVVQ